MKKNKHNPKPTERIIDNISYLRNTNVAEARKVVSESKDLPHLKNGKIKFLIKN